MSVSSDVAWIGRDFRCNDVAKSLKNIINLGSYVRRKNVIANGTMQLQRLVEILLRETMSKDDDVRLFEWSSSTLAPEETNMPV